ncbi:MAG: lytic murein transglycosylase B [Gammaproteobacteria bacterium SHHR-1]
MNRLIPLLLCLPLGTALAASGANLQAFIDQMHQQHGTPKQEVADLLAQAQHQQKIIDAMQRRAEKHKAWHEYRAIFMTDKRIQGGVQFWQDNAQLLQQAQREFGVPAQIIVAILGVETLYGTRTGDMRVLDALYTLAFNYPKRADFFHKELMQFILLAKEANFDPTQVTGSYAGAMGAAQFISSSYRHYAIDYDKDGRTDLWSSPADMIGSIANYLKLNGWQAGGPVAVPALGVDAQAHQGLFFAEPGRSLKEVVGPKDRPTHPLPELAKAGIQPATPLETESLAYLMAFEQPNRAFEHWLGLHNFYVITRYNRSPLYAMAVYQLAQAIAEQYQGQSPARPQSVEQENPFVFH